MSSNFQALRFCPFHYLEQEKKGMIYKAGARAKCKEMTIWYSTTENFLKFVGTICYHLYLQVDNEQNEQIILK